MTEPLARLATALADRYKIERELGAGGMAVVYLAYDIRHDRRVALKVLRPELSAILGAQRFLKEIRLTANLQHPHILPLHDSGEADGLVFYVMPYVEGESLRDRLKREHQLPVDEAVRLAREVASALDYAHRHDVVHRDIKPENILLHEGQALVADFGIALAASRSDAGTRMTETGMSLGTPHYMSPEQAMGERDITPKSDVYALGCVLYEMLVGEPPFTGPTAQAIIARVVTEEVRSLTMQRKTIPPHIEAAVHTALQKLPADRFASAAQFSEALAAAGTRRPSRRVTAPRASTAGAPPAPTRRTRFRPSIAHLPWAVAAVALAVAAFLALRPRATPAVYRFDVAVPDSVNINTAQNGISMTLSRRGNDLVYVGRGPRGQRQLLVRALGQLEPRPLVGTEGAESPFISPDGAWVGFFADGKLKKIALAGGPPLAIADAPTPRGGAWGPDDRIIFAPTPTAGLLSVSAAGGTVDTLTTVRVDSGETSHRFPDILPDGRSVLFTVQYGARYRIGALRLGDKGPHRTVLDEAMSARWSPTGHLIYASDAGALLAVPFNARSLAVTGSPISLLEGLLVKVGSGAAEFTISPAGTLVYLSGSLAKRALVLVDRDGRERVLTEAIALTSPRFSPDGRRIALSSIEQRNSDVRVLDIARGTLSRLSFEGINQYPEWTPDGRRISFVSSRPGAQGQDIFWAPADGSGEPTILAGGPGGQWEVAWAPDGRSLALRENTGPSGRDLATMLMDSARTKRPYLTAQFDERSPTMSPDGHWLAYASNESGRDEIYVRAFPQPSGRWQVSAKGGTEPRWARTGGEIYYRNGDTLVSAAVSVRPTFSVGAHHVLFTRSYFSDPSHAHYDVQPNNRGFVMVRAGAEHTSLVVVLGWFEELRRRSAARP